MDRFTYRRGRLHAEDVPIERIAAAVGTPVYVYSAATLERHYRVFERALSDMPHLICYAVKANANLAVIAVLARLGAGADVVSGGEMERAVAAGIPPKKIVFSGVGKTEVEMRRALELGIRRFNVESAPELERLDAVARAARARAPIAIRINPDVDAGSHVKISTGNAESKFGVGLRRARDLYAAARRMEGIEIAGVDVHIGSQLTGLQPYRDAFLKVARLTDDLRADGHDIRTLDLGGGLGIPYRPTDPPPPSPRDYARTIRETVGRLGCGIEVEPGRLIAGNAGLLVSEILYRKEEERDFLVLDAAMNDLIRPAMYDAWHEVIPVAEPAPDAPVGPVDIVGPVCETGDIFARGREMARLEAGDLVAFRSAGAYAAAMSSEYNSRPLIPEVLVSGDRFAVIRKRPTYAEMLARDSVPDWLTQTGREETE